jgi:hypothetical protein
VTKIERQPRKELKEDSSESRKVSHLLFIFLPFIPHRGLLLNPIDLAVNVIRPFASAQLKRNRRTVGTFFFLLFKQNNIKGGGRGLLCRTLLQCSDFYNGLGKRKLFKYDRTLNVLKIKSLWDKYNITVHHQHPHDRSQTEPPPKAFLVL